MVPRHRIVRRRAWGLQIETSSHELVVAVVALLKWGPHMRASYLTDEWKLVVPVPRARDREGVTLNRVALLMLISK